MKNSIYLFFHLLTAMLMLSFANAEKELPDACYLGTSPKQGYSLGKQLGFFAQPLDDERIMFMGPPGPDGYRNKGKQPSLVYNLSRRMVKPSTWDLDPFPTPDGKFYIHPNGIAFYDAKKIDTFGERAKPVAEFNDQQGWYQSVGQYKDSNGNTFYRVVTSTTDHDFKTGTMRDYRLVQDASKKESIVPAGTPIALCGNIQTGNQLSLPILSRNGKMISLFNPNTRTTQIYDLSSNGTCNLRVDLGLFTGKGNFSYDGTKFVAPVLWGSHPPRQPPVEFDLEIGPHSQPPRLVLPPRSGLVVNYTTYLPNGQLISISNTRETEENSIAFRSTGIHRRSDSQSLPLRKEIASALKKHCSDEYSDVATELIEPFIDHSSCMAFLRWNPGKLTDAKNRLKDCEVLRSSSNTRSSESGTSR